jgi:phenol hydroxylase P0 protein
MAALTSFVRVTGLRREKFVEFEFSVGDPDLTIELILPTAAFAEFCAENQVTMLPPAPDGAAAMDRLGPGLYRRPEQVGD